MDLFNIVCKIYSIVGLLVYVFIASKMIKITKNFNYNNSDNHFKVIDKESKNIYNGLYIWRG